MTDRFVKPTALHQEFRNDLLDLLRKHAGLLDAQELLALAAHVVGQIVAVQDKDTMSTARAMEIVSKNIEQGNSEALESLRARLN